MADSPSIENLSLLTAVLKWKPQGDVSYRDLGECEVLTTSMDFTTLPYMSHRGGSLVQVKEATTGKTLTVSITMNEASDLNLAMFMSGDIAGDPAVIQIGTAQHRGSLRAIGKNDEGIKSQMDLYDVIFTPTGDTDWLKGDEWAGFQLEGRALAYVNDDGKYAFGELRPDTDGTEQEVSPP